MRRYRHKLIDKCCYILLALNVGLALAFILARYLHL